MSRKELPRPGLIQAALTGRITNREGATALGITLRHFQRLKQRVRVGGALALRHRSRGQPSRRRLPPGVRIQVQDLLQHYVGFNDTHLTEKLQDLHGLGSRASPCDGSGSRPACPPGIAAVLRSIAVDGRVKSPPGNSCSWTAVPSPGSRSAGRC